jgi:hypothetical protein
MCIQVHSQAHVQLSMSESRISPMGRGGGRTEGGLDDADLGRGGVEPGEGAPVVDDEAGADDVGAAIYGPSL